MKYAALLTSNADDIAAWEKLSPEEAAAAGAEEVPKWEALFDELGPTGELGFGAELDSPTTAKTVRVRDGETIVTDGPFAETKEQIGGADRARRRRPRRGDRDRGPDPGRLPRVRRAEARRSSIDGRSRAVFREEWGRAVAVLTRVLGDLELAEDAVQDAFAIALERWPRDGDAARTPAPGSSPPRATARSTGSGASRRSPARPSCSPGSRRCRPRRTT